MTALRAVAALLLLLLPLLAGCLDGPLVEPAQAGGVSLAGAAAVPLGEALRWEGAFLRGAGAPSSQDPDAYACWLGDACDAADFACDGAATGCERVPFRVEGASADVIVSIRWPTHPRLDFALRIEDGSGAIVARGEHSFVSTLGLVAHIENAAPGEYAAVVWARGDDGAYQGAVRADAPMVAGPGAGGEPRELLPNLVTLPPTDLTLETPDYAGVSYFAFGVPLVRPAMEAAGTKGCRVDEAVESEGRRCLRFSNAVGNVGEGPLDVRLPALDAATSALDGRFVQRVHRDDGTFAETDVGRVEWHVTHAHWHNAANDRFTVHAYDEAAGERGALLSEGRKMGICFADIGLVDVGLRHQSPAASDGAACLKPSTEHGYAMGLTPGWYDLYHRVMSDQFVDITGLPDGAYALCSVTNQDGVLRESDLSDNEACTAFRLTGNAVESIDEAPYHATPPEAGA